MRDKYHIVIQHAVCLADSAERYLDKTNALCFAQGGDGEVHDPEEIVDAEIEQSEAFEHLKNAIYEFRKRLTQLSSGRAGRS